AMSGLPAELPLMDLMRHPLTLLVRGGHLVLTGVLGAGRGRLLGALFGRVGRARLGRLDETAGGEPLLDLVEGLLAEVAHPPELLVGRLQELPDLRDAVALQ